MGWSAAYVVDEWLGDDLVVEWNISASWKPFTLTGNNPDAQKFINDTRTITREKRGPQDIVRLTVGYTIRKNTRYSCWDCAKADAERLGNDIVFREGHGG